MATPYLPLVSISRSQKIRLGRGAGNCVLPEFNLGDALIHPQSGNLVYAFYANMTNPTVLRDIGHHSAIGALLDVGTVDTTHNSDLFAPSGVVASAGTGLTISVTAGVLKSRIFGSELNIPAVSSGIAVAPNTSGNPRYDTLLINPNGSFEVVTGVSAPTQVYEIDTLTPSGTITGGTFTLTFTYGGVTYTTASQPFNQSAANIASAMQVAGNLPGTLTGTGGPISTTLVTLTASAGLTGPITGLKVNSSLTGTTPLVTPARSTSGVQGPVAPVNGGGCATVANFTVANNATQPSAFVNPLATS